MANIGEKAISFLAENLNLGRSYLITAVLTWLQKYLIPAEIDFKGYLRLLL